MPFIKITTSEDRAAGRGPGAPAVLPRSYRAAIRNEYTQWVPVRSSWIKAVRFNKAAGTLDVRHNTGKVYYAYPNMTADMMRGLMTVRSAGRWMWRYYPPRHIPMSKKSGSRPTRFGRSYHRR